jgi:hypothetical protein
MLTWHCDLNHEKTQYFDSKAIFDMHTREAHANLTSTQIIARIKRSKATRVRPQLTCPLCEEVPDKLQASNIQLPLEDARSVLARHVGSHIKALSLLSFRLVPSNGVEQVTAVSLGLSNNLSMDLGQTLSGVDGSRRLSDIDSELAQSAEKLRKLRMDLETARGMLLTVKRRETLRKECLDLDRQVFEQRQALRDTKRKLGLKASDDDLLINQTSLDIRLHMPTSPG